MLNRSMTKAARDLLALCRRRGLHIATAESCTGGLLSAALTEIPGSSDVFDRGFITYSNQAKQQTIKVPARILTKFGAVSRETALAMAKGALSHSSADIAIAITGIAGPGGGTTEKPVGLVHIAVAMRGKVIHRACRFGDIGRGKVREKSVLQALAMLTALAKAARARSNTK